MELRGGIEEPNRDFNFRMQLWRYLGEWQDLIFDYEKGQSRAAEDIVHIWRVAVEYLCEMLEYDTERELGE